MSCQVILQSATGNFFPGGAVQGTVNCSFNNRIETRGIRVKLRGREHTSWTKRESYYDSSSKSTKYRTVHYSGDHKFIANQINVANPGSMGPGRFEYPFQFNLPNRCPSSYRTPHGRVWYYVKVTVDIPWAPDYESEVDFNVVAPIDFNVMPEIIMNPTHYSDEKDLCCCCCANGPITMDLDLDKEAYVLGEVMRLRVHLVNMSNESLTGLDVKLKLHTKEIATSPSHDSKYSEELIARLRDTGVGAHGDRDYDLQLVIPANLILPNFSMCSLFESWSTLEVEGEIPGCHSNLTIGTGIKLGHVPLVTGARMAQTVYVDGGTYPAAPPPAPYPPNDAAPPYPGGMNDFSIPQVPPYNEKEMPGVHTPMPMPMPMPTPSGPPYPPEKPGANGLPPYPSGNSSAPYPPGPTATPYPPGPTATPYPPGPSATPYPPGPSANAPPEEGAPSAPPKAPLGEEDDFEIVASGECRPGQPSSGGPAPPSYFDAMDSRKAEPPYPPK